MSIVGKLLRLNPREWRDLVRAQLALLRAQWRLRRQPVGTMVGRDALASGDTVSGDLERARAVATALTRAASHGVFRPQCLARSIALRDLLAADGIAGSEIKVGVRRDDGRLHAHAWVVWNGHVLGDTRAWVSRFTEVNDLRVLQQR